ncbi:glycosyl hydrolase family 18 protein [Sedimentibacter sp. MB31-C6]|uniref:glycosyl hydrolase family 18 protein n=1 Tax=Sedimentibacter sp. MB31-C6 TaxID=3109366 RepID=UPI002DDDA63A|nr:LysM peptidoglycan-binding domain-containing protein [Sedimentibacter sp. MB36-C1]WSI03343.1 LysM peptidoglycan-binding domain-containing protein [Sedimentibacter sp. MB36-C1]
MIIHVVQPGDSIYSIAATYNALPRQIIRDNQLANPNYLVPGQTIVVLFPSQYHTVRPGDTLSSIAEMYDTSVVKLMQNNLHITDPTNLALGEEIVISYEEPKIGPIHVNGYAYPIIDRNVLRKTLPYLTYLTLFTYGITPEGNLIDIEDEELIQMAREYGVAPLMLISTLTEEGTFSNELASVILNNQEAQNNLIENVLNTLKTKNYYGLDVDFEFILPEDRDAYTQFIRNLTNRLNEEGFIVFTALAPKVSADQPGLLYEAHDYPALGDVSNRVLLMTYEWGYTYGPAMAVAPVDKVREVLDYAITEIDPNKIYMGIPNYGYDFILPFVEGVSRAESLSNVEAVELAGEVGEYILYDETAQSPYYVYYDAQGRQHQVWFEDARSIQAKLDLFNEYGFEGVSYWNIMRFFPQNWLVVNSLYDIAKVL